MTISAFPPVEDSDEDGLLAIGGDLEVESLLLAYSSGIFPWPFDAKVLAWFAPPKRAILHFSSLRINRSFKKALRDNHFDIRIDTSFEEVIRSCKNVKRAKQRGTWITRDIENAYIELHKQGHAHSFECFLNDKLVGGIYGISIGKFFAGESMFHTYPDASKVALHGLAHYLSLQGGTWMDCQVMNPFLSSIGAIEIPRSEFMEQLSSALSAKEPFNFIKGAFNGFPTNRR